MMTAMSAGALQTGKKACRRHDAVAASPAFLIEK
jgi:hypothetical protein